jgi:hypothetical protein
MLKILTFGTTPYPAVAGIVENATTVIADDFELPFTVVANLMGLFFCRHFHHVKITTLENLVKSPLENKPSRCLPSTKSLCRYSRRLATRPTSTGYKAPFSSFHPSQEPVTPWDYTAPSWLAEEV